MTLSRSRIALVALILVLAACSGGTATTGASGTPVSGGGASPTVFTPAPTATPIVTPTPSPPPSASLGPLPTDFDACTLLTNDEASAINGSSYPAGVNHVLNSGFIECVWQTPTPPSSITVQVLATSGDTSAQEAYAEAQATLHGFALTPVPNFADEAVIARAPGGLPTCGIYVRDGGTYFDVVSIGGTVPSDGALTLAATLVLGAIP